MNKRREFFDNLNSWKKPHEDYDREHLSVEDREFFDSMEQGVEGPNSAIDGHVAVFDGITGKIIKDGGALTPGTSQNLQEVTDIGAVTTNAIEIAGMKINQLADDAGLQIDGFDDVNSKNIKLFIDNAGETYLKTSDTFYLSPFETTILSATNAGQVIFDNKYFGFGTSNNFQQQYNSISGKLELSDGTNNFLTVEDLGITAAFDFLGTAQFSGDVTLGSVPAGTQDKLLAVDAGGKIIEGTASVGGSGIYTTVSGFTGTDINVALAAGDNIYLPSGAYDISDVAVTVPAGKVMRFEDGAVISGTNILTGNNTVIEAGRSQIFDKDLIIIGNTVAEEGYTFRDYSGVHETTEPVSGDWNRNTGETIVRLSRIDSYGRDNTDELLKLISGTRLWFAEEDNESVNFKIFDIEATPVLRTNSVEYTVSSATSVGTITTGMSCGVGLHTVPLATRWVYDYAHVEWFGAGVGNIVSSSDAAAIQRTLNVFIKRVGSFGHKYWIEKTIIFPQNGDWTSGMDTLFSGIKTMHDTYLNVPVPSFSIAGGQWSHPNYSEMDGGTLNDAYTNWLWDWQWNKTIRLGYEFRRSSSVKDVKLFSGYSNGMLNVNHKLYHASGWRIKTHDDNQSGKSYFAHISNVYIGWLNEALDVDGWRSDLHPGQTGGMTNSWQWDHITIDNNYQGITIRVRSEGNIFSGLILQPKNNAVASEIMIGTNTASVFKIDSAEGDRTGMFVANSYVRLTPTGSDVVYAWCTGSSWDGSNTYVDLIADRTHGYSSTGTYLRIEIVYGAFPLLDVSGFYNVINGMTWDVWFENTYTFQSNSAHNEMNTMGWPKLADFIWNKSTNQTSNNFQQDHFFKNVVGIYDSYKGHIVNRPEITQLRLHTDMKNAPNITGIDTDSLVLGRELVFWGDGIGDEAASNGLLRYWDGVDSDDYASNRIKIKSGEPIRLYDDVLVDEQIFSKSTAGAEYPLYFYNLQSISRGSGIASITSTPTSYPITFFGEGVFSSNTSTEHKTIATLRLSSGANDLISLTLVNHVDGGEFCVYRRSTWDGLETLHSGITIPVGTHFQVAVVINSDTSVTFYANGEISTITTPTWDWAELDDNNFTAIHVGCQRTATYGNFQGHLSRVGIKLGSLSFSQIVQLFTNKSMAPIGFDMLAFYGNLKEAVTWTDKSDNGHDLTMLNTSLVI